MLKPWFCYLLCIAAFLQVHVCLAQNLVINSSFEDRNICTERSQPCSPSGWFYIRKDVVAGYYSPQHATDGWRYLTVATAKKDNSTRSYWESELLCPLAPGETYTIRLRVAANAIGPNLNDIGLYFTDAFIFVRRDSLLQPENYLSLLGAKVKELRNDWFQLEKEFTATAAHRYIIIGNFSEEANRHIYRKRNIKDDVMFMYLDNLEIIPKNRLPCTDMARVKDSLYAVHERHSINGRSVIKEIAVVPPSDVPGDTDRQEQPAVRTAGAPVASAGPSDTTAGRKGPSSASIRVDTVKIDNIQFEFNSYVVKDLAVLDSMREVFMGKDITRIQVIGYTDDVGSDGYNLDLSEKRAEEIRRLIAQKFGIPTALISAEGKGISTSYTDKSRNRRVEVYIYHG